MPQQTPGSLFTWLLRLIFLRAVLLTTLTPSRSTAFSAPLVYFCVSHISSGLRRAFAPPCSRPLHSLPARARSFALRLARSAVALRPTDAILWANLGLALAALGQTEGALLAFDRSASISPLHAEAHIGAASVLPREEAVRTLERAVALVPTHAGAYYNLGKLLHETPERRRSMEAVSCFARAATLEPTHAEAHYNHALAAQHAHLEAHLPVAAIETSYRRALAIAPRHAPSLSRLVTTLQWEGREAEAAHAAERGVRLGLWMRPMQRPSLLVSELEARPWWDAEAYLSTRNILRKASTPPPYTPPPPDPYRPPFLPLSVPNPSHPESLPTPS